MVRPDAASSTEAIVKPTLLVLAAGMGSRYGGLKQIDPVGPGGETIIDYSIYDALRAGLSHASPSLRDLQQAAGAGFRTLREDGLLKAVRGVTSLAEIFAITGQEEPPAQAAPLPE